MSAFESFSEGASAVVVGSNGGIGRAVFELLTQDGRFAEVRGYSRNSLPRVDVTDEATIEAVARQVAAARLDLRLVIVATGVLQEAGLQPEKRMQQLNERNLTRAFHVNAIGPALVMKHFLPLMARQGKALFAVLSARVGSIGDNHLGGWYGYRASKAALNQFVRCASIEVARRHPDAICLALHPGTVDTALSADHSKQGLEVRSAKDAALLLMQVVDKSTRDMSGKFLDYRGLEIPW